MEKQKTSTLNNSLIWFGAAVSIAEIFTGTLLAPLGFTKGFLAIILGHAIGCILLYLAGLIGAKTEKSAMETVKLSFGSKGAAFFSVLNIIQLVGWTAVMVISGARATGVLINPLLGTNGINLWAIIIGALIILWILIGIQNLGKLNIAAMSMLFLITVKLSTVIFRKGSLSDVSEITGNMSFGAAVELSAAMPLSWLPLISDYTRGAKNPQRSTAASTATYFAISCWMYIIGLGAVLFFKQSDIAQIMLQAGLGLLGILIIIFSTVTTTFMDAYSAGVSFSSITQRFGEKLPAVIVCILGTVLAIFTPIEQYEGFLFMIGSVFAPMISILITDFFILKKELSHKSFNIVNFLIWVFGFITYRLFMKIDTPVGSTLPVMIITSITCLIINGGIVYVQRNTEKCEG